jgi:RNA polymerase sigma factor (sigma-70 family)
VLRAAQGNEPWAFESLYTEFAPAVAGYLRLNGVADADSLANEVMLGVFRGLHSFEGDRVAFRSWLFTIAHHRLVDDRRRRSVRPEATELLDRHDGFATGDVEQEALVGLEEERLLKLLESLTPDQRTVVLLRVVADLSLEEVASLLGKRVGAVKMLQRRGLAALREIITSERVTS